MSRQTSSHIMMVRPANFGFNEQTAESNAFQTNDQSVPQSEISTKAIAEFDAMVAKLRSVGIHVKVIQDTPVPVKPDAVFPNNWVSFHNNGTLVTYPMFTPNRQAEIREEILLEIKKEYKVKKHVRFERFIRTGIYLEGTGSMILDRENRIVYACISARTQPDLLYNFAEWAEYEPILFLSKDAEGLEIYHTNVMMALGETFVVICLDSIPDPEEKRILLNKFAETNKEVIEISYMQMLSFAGNMLQLRNDKGDTYLVMSDQAHKSLTHEQIVKIQTHTNILPVKIDTIENFGGGSARCMIAENFLPLNE